MDLQKNLFKSFLFYPTLKKWGVLKTLHSTMIRERDATYDLAMQLIQEHHQTQNSFPSRTAFQMKADLLQEQGLLSFLKEIESDTDHVAIEDESEFVVYSQVVEKALYDNDLYSTVSKLGQKIMDSEKKDLDSQIKLTEELITSLHQVKNRVLRTDLVTSGLVYGLDVVDQMKDMYAKIEDQNNKGEHVYYTTGFKKFEHVKITPGDLVVIGGFTSHGKSVLLRYLIYRFITEYGLNCMYSTIEMDYKQVLLMFQVLHANNTKKYPCHPTICFEKVREGKLSPEEKHHLFDVAAKDFCTSKEYGTLYVEYPNKSRYRLSEIKSKAVELENTKMRIHAVGIDYLTMLYPVDSDRSKPDRQDYNLMIKEFKNTALSHRDRNGIPSPFIALTPAQISRGGLEEAQKNNYLYDLSALREYSELESSADIVLTTMLNDEMRLQKILQIQNLKNRSGRLNTDPIQVNIDLEYGFTLTETRTRNSAQQAEAIQKLSALKI